MSWPCLSTPTLTLTVRSAMAPPRPVGRFCRQPGGRADALRRPRPCRDAPSGHADRCGEVAMPPTVEFAPSPSRLRRAASADASPVARAAADAPAKPAHRLRHPGDVRRPASAPLKTTNAASSSLNVFSVDAGNRVQPLEDTGQDPGRGRDRG